MRVRVTLNKGHTADDKGVNRETVKQKQIDHLGLKVFPVKLDKLKVKEFGDGDNDEWDMMKMC